VHVTVHELGHAAFNIGHPDGTTSAGQTLPDCSAITADTVMLDGGSHRNLGNWDLEVSQQRYGSRIGAFQKSRMTGATTWRLAGAGQIGSRPQPLFRMGSLGEAVNVRALAWAQGSSTLYPGGAGPGAQTGVYDFGMSGISGVGTTTLGRPIATAAKTYTGIGIPGSGETIVAYEKASNSIYDDSSGTICYRRSTSSGMSYGAETCTVDTTKVYGLTAEYDQYSDTFLVAYVTATQSVYNEIVIITVPALGSSTPGNSTILTYNLNIATALHAPKIACTGQSVGCWVFYETVTGDGYLAAIIAGISKSTGAVTGYGTYSWPGLPFWDTPGAVFDLDDKTFRITQTDSNNAIFSYKALLPNRAFRSTVSPSSSYTSADWGPDRVVDGRVHSEGGSLGWSSAVPSAVDHQETLEIDMASVETFNTVVLYPRDDAGNVGTCFPVNFTISVWNGVTWIPRVTVSNSPQPSGAMSYTWTPTDVTDRVLITGQNLRRDPNGDYAMQFAEIEVLNSVPPSFSGTGDVYNNPTSQISSGVLSTRLMGSVTGSEKTRPFAWFVKFW
jgi:hypothetical protein